MYKGKGHVVSAVAEGGCQAHAELAPSSPRLAQLLERHAVEVLEALHVERLPKAAHGGLLDGAHALQVDAHHVGDGLPRLRLAVVEAMTQPHDVALLRPQREPQHELELLATLGGLEQLGGGRQAARHHVGERGGPHGVLVASDGCLEREYARERGRGCDLL
eukprot:scaffold41331_cov65-Phaeocystis_antarctica.AAC.1